MQMIRVKGMRQSVNFGGKRYGPSDKPLDVPLDLAGTLGLVPVEGVAAGDSGVTQEADAAAQKLMAQLQGNLNLLLDQLKPYAESQETPDQTLGRLLKEQGEDRFAAERDDLQGQLEQQRQEAQRQAKLAEEAGVQIASLTAERDDLQGQLDAVTPLPGNALALLQTVKGIGPDMAQKALDALQSGQPSDGK